MGHIGWNLENAANDKWLELEKTILSEVTQTRKTNMVLTQKWILDTKAIDN